MRAFLLSACILAGMFAKSQDSALTSVVIHKDSRLDLLVKKQIEINEETTRNSRKAGKGFRLLVANTNNRDEAMNAKAKLYQYFPELRSYIYYQSPNFKVKAGNFRERKEAETYQRRLNKYFPKGVFVMADVIELKSEE